MEWFRFFSALQSVFASNMINFIISFHFSCSSCRCFATFLIMLARRRKKNRETTNDDDAAEAKTSFDGFRNKKLLPWYIRHSDFKKGKIKRPTVFTMFPPSALTSVTSEAGIAMCGSLVTHLHTISQHQKIHWKYTRKAQCEVPLKNFAHNNIE